MEVSGREPGPQWATGTDGAVAGAAPPKLPAATHPAPSASREEGTATRRRAGAAGWRGGTPMGGRYWCQGVAATAGTGRWSRALFEDQPHPEGDQHGGRGRVETAADRGRAHPV